MITDSKMILYSMLKNNFEMNRFVGEINKCSILFQFDNKLQNLLMRWNGGQQCTHDTWTITALKWRLIFAVPQNNEINRNNVVLGLFYLGILYFIFHSKCSHRKLKPSHCSTELIMFDNTA
uniref:Uncharacterized protein n=1 Tax=Cacopsylla melanoneura TaxID=428564 RepID=A0A8D9AZ82_9HEMI